MVRLAITGAFCLWGALFLGGCTSMFTARAIDSFNAGLASEDVAELKLATSSEFQHRALRIGKAMDSLKILPLPTETGEISEVQEISPEERLVSVQYGDPEQPETVQYRLKRETSDDGKRKWVVDDVILTQQRSGSKAPLSKSVTEQMDLLLTVQEFLDYWQAGSREQAVAVLHPDLRATLEPLSPVHLAQITDEMLEGVKTETFRPEVRMKSDVAAVLIPRRSGKLVLDLLRVADEPGRPWRVNDIAVESARDETAGRKVSELARVVGAATEFLQAYERQDRDALSKLASDGFYHQALVAADLSTAPLPTIQMLAKPFSLEQQGERADLIFELGESTYLVSMSHPTVDPADDKAPTHRVDEVTIYEQGGKQIKPLSSAFTAQGIVEVFAEALATRDAALLQQLSTPDFRRKVWDRLEAPELLGDLPIEGIPAAPPRIVSTIFQGAVTEITVTQGNRALTYELHATGGRPQVHDVKLASNNRSGSLKTTLETLVPVYNFAWGWQRQDKDTLTRNSSDGMRRMVWTHSRDIPQIPIAVHEFLTQAPGPIEEIGRERVVALGSPERGARVRLVRDGERLVVEDIHLTGRELSGGRLELVNAMRDWHASRSGMDIPAVGRPRVQFTNVTPIKTPNPTPPPESTDRLAVRPDVVEPGPQGGNPFAHPIRIPGT